jgi:hypothetical protein
MNARRRGSIGIVVLLVVGCGSEEREPPPLDGTTGRAEPSAEFDPCGTPDHPCTLAEVSPEARAATRALAQEVGERLFLPGGLAGVVGWLRKRDDVAHVAVGSEGLRFRVRGGRGHWVLVRTAGTVATLGAPLSPLPSRSETANSASSSSTGAPAQQGTTGRRAKRALLVSPFRWQWQVEARASGEIDRGGRGTRYAPDGIDEVAEALRARDYDEVRIMAEGLHPTDPTRTTGVVGLQAFTTWDEYDYVHLLTHGASVCEEEEPGERRVCMPSLLAPWTADFVIDRAMRAESEDNAALGRILEMMGVETATSWFGVTTAELPSDRTGSFRVSATPEQIPDVRHGTVERRPSPAASDGTARTLVGDFLILSPSFFHAVYPQGVSNAIVVLSACSSGHTPNLLGAVKGENSVVLGWKDTMSLGAAVAAGTLLAKALVEVDEEVESDSGLTVEQSVVRIRDWLDDVMIDPPSAAACREPLDRETVARCAVSDYGRVLTVFNDVPVDRVTGSMLVMEGDSTLRAREVVYLVDQRGRELEDGAVVRLVEASDRTGRPAAQFRFRMDGLGLEEDPQAVDLRIEHDGREFEVQGEMEEEVAPGVWETDYQLPLSDGARAGDRITVEAIADLPDGGETRWEYRDLLLSGCYWNANVSGATSEGGSIEAYWGTARTDDGPWPPLDIDAIVQDGDPQPARPWLRLTLTNQGTAPRFNEIADWREIHLAIPGIQPGATGSFSRVWGTLHMGTESYDGNAQYLRRDVIGLPEGTGIGRLLTTSVVITRYDDLRVVGSFEGRFLDLPRVPLGERTPPGVGVHDFPDAEIRVSGEFDLLLDQSCRTRSGLR